MIMTIRTGVYSGVDEFRATSTTCKLRNKKILMAIAQKLLLTVLGEVRKETIASI